MSLEERMMILNCIEHFVLSHAIPFTLCLFKRKSFCSKRIFKLYPDDILLYWDQKMTNAQINSTYEKVVGQGWGL